MRTTETAAKRNRSKQVILLALLLAALALLFLRFAHKDPQRAFDHAVNTLHRGDLATASREAEHGYLHFRKSEPVWGWRFRILHATALNWQGKNEEVIAALESPPDPLPLELAIQTKSLQGSAHASLHHFSDAEQKLGEAKQLCGNSQSVACTGVIAASAGLEMEHLHYANAQALFEKTVGLARAQNDKFREAKALLNLGWSALAQQHFDEALDWSNSAYQISTTMDYGDIAQNALGNLAWAYYKLGDITKAEGLFREAKERAQRLADLVDQVKWTIAGAYIDLDERHFSQAADAYRQALSLAERINSKEDILNAWMSLALVYSRTGEFAEAERASNRAIELARADGNRLDELYPLLVKGQIAARQNDPTRAEAIFREVASDPNSDISLKWEAEHSLAKLYDDEGQTDIAGDEYRTALCTFETARGEVKNEESELPFLTNGTRIYDDYVHFLVSRHRDVEALQVADFSRAQTLAEGLGRLKKSTPCLAAGLDPRHIARQIGSAILFYWLGQQQSYLWTITPTTVGVFQLPGASEIDAAVQRYRKVLVGPQSALEVAAGDGTGLYEMLVAPAQSLIADQKKVTIVSDDTLNSLNFETLLMKSPKLHYWIEDVTLNNASSLRMLASARSVGTGGTAKLLLIGDPVTPDPTYGALPKAAQEVINVEKHFAPGARKSLTRAAATASAYFASSPEQFDYIHFVAHGTASRISPLDSAVILSRPAGGSEAFKLYARDIITHPLHANLVTISTCFGAGTRSYAGEGLVGLSWAFMRAGAHNVIGALWEVNDISTPQLMDLFYAELAKGRTPDVALRAAKLSLLKSGTALNKPFYWAPFQLYTGS
jgi:CHAT domain-containing protein/tetratricopeptide (TPR) repeat protein